MRLQARPGNIRLLSSTFAGRLVRTLLFVACVGLIIFIIPSAKEQIPIVRVGAQLDDHLLIVAQPDAVTGILSSPTAVLENANISASDAAPDAASPVENAPTGRERHLHLLMHAPFSQDTLCKSVASSLVLDYPTPWLLNWHHELEANNDNLDKFKAFTGYLDSIPAGRDEDLVLVVDPYNTWFQLRPEVLIRRYFDINAKAAERLRSRPGSQGSSTLTQSILFAAQRSCWPWAPNDPTCLSIPESTLPENIYGPDTDTYQGDQRFPQATFRQRYLNSGAFIGPVAAMKTLMLRAKQIAFTERSSKDQLKDMWTSADWSTRGDQVVFQRIFKEQEMARAHGNCSQWESSREKCEFGIGLDYESRLTQAHAFNKGDMDWMRHDWLGESSGAPTTASEGGLETRDLLDTQQPFSDLDGEYQPGWDELLLYTNQFTNVVPALVHHDMDAENLGHLGGQAWAKMWYQSHFWDMLEARVNGSTTKKLATTNLNDEEIEWWSPPQVAHEQKGAYSGQGKIIPWNDICGHWMPDDA